MLPLSHRTASPCSWLLHWISSCILPVSMWLDWDCKEVPRSWCTTSSWCYTDKGKGLKKKKKHSLVEYCNVLSSTEKTKSNKQSEANRPALTCWRRLLKLAESFLLIYPSILPSVYPSTRLPFHIHCQISFVTCYQTLLWMFCIYVALNWTLTKTFQVPMHILQVKELKRQSTLLQVQKTAE